MTIPLFQDDLKEAKRQEAQSKLKETEWVYQQQQRQIQTAIKLQSVNLESAIAQRAALIKAYDQTQKSQALIEADYRLGLVNYLEVIQSLNALLTAKQQVEEAEVNCRRYDILLKIERQDLP